MNYNNTKNITIFSIIALFTMTSFGLSNVFAEEIESEGYNMIGDITPVLTFTFRDGIEIYEFPVFEMGENFVTNSGTSFSVEGTVTYSPMLHKAMDEAYEYRTSQGALNFHHKYFDVAVDFVKDNESIITLDYNQCRVDNYQVETLDSNDYESYFKEVGFAIVDKIDFFCSGMNFENDVKTMTTSTSFTDFGESEFKFANDVKTAVTFSFIGGVEKIEFPVFNLLSSYDESINFVPAEFQVEGVLEHYPLLYDAIDKSRSVFGLTLTSNSEFDALVEFTNGESVLRGVDFKACRVSDAKIKTQTDKEEGFTGKSGFVLVHQLTFTCNGLQPINMYYDDLFEDIPMSKITPISNEYVEPIQNSDKGLSAFTTFTFSKGTETIEFSMIKQSEVLTSTVSISDPTITDAAAYPTLELRGIVGDYPLLYNYVDTNRKLTNISGSSMRELVNIDVDLVYGDEVVRGFNYINCRPLSYVVATETNNEESYVKNQFALENKFEFECQGYHPNNPIYDAMHVMPKADTESTFDLRNTQKWGPNFSVQK